MTSGNISEEPIAWENHTAIEKLSGLADAFLLHDRDIYIRCDDSVARYIPCRDPKLVTTIPSDQGSIRSFDENLYILRRARGFAPTPILLPWSGPPLLAGGAELKNTFCFSNDNRAFVSHHIGDLENFETLKAFEESVEHYQRLFRVKPETFAHDLHPDYLATRYIQTRAKEEGQTAIGVQHHHAHIAACMAEHGLAGNKPVIGISFDGTGYGDDGAIWGGEIMVANYAGYERAFHLSYVPMPGGDLAIREPWRMAFSHLVSSDIEIDDQQPFIAGLRQSIEPDRDVVAIVRNQIQSGLNSPPTSSVGRLFDAVAAIAGVRFRVNYEGQAAMELECLIDYTVKSSYSLPIAGNLIDLKPLIVELVSDVRTGVAQGTISAKFHNALVNLVLHVCLELRQSHGLSDVIISGGVWQNSYMLTKSIEQLTKHHFKVLIHRQVPPNDGGLSLGQVAVAQWKLSH